MTQATQAQTFTVLHNFTGGADGANPFAGLTWDRAGNLYGTTTYGGYDDHGTVFKLSRKGSSWLFTPLYNFQGGNDGVNPRAALARGLDGTLYGTTYYGGGYGCSDYGCGTVFNVRPSTHASANVFGEWVETVSYRFLGGLDGANPEAGVIFDRAGGIYGTTRFGGLYGWGAAFGMTPSDGGWTETVIYSFTGGADGAMPGSSLIFDTTGNLYGTTYGMSLDNPYGTVYELSPTETGWAEKTLYTFRGGSDGANPAAGLTFDQSGNLYGTTDYGGSGHGGTIFQLVQHPNGSWTFTLLYSFSGSPGSNSSLTLDAAGNLYGTSYWSGSHGFGSVFELIPSNGNWRFTSLHDFTDESDGAYPLGNIVFDADGSLFSTTSAGGTYGNGLIFEITP
jgi:uncharacterized repeat protein (TIGR03803 family)